MEITSENFKELIEAGKPVVVDFWATWCGPCMKLGPAIQSLAEKYEGKAIVGKCNIDEDEELPEQFGVTTIPTVLFIKNGEIKDKQIGLCPLATLEEKLEAIL